MVFTEEERRDMYRWVRVLGIMSAVVVVVVVVVVGDEGGVGSFVHPARFIDEASMPLKSPTDLTLRMFSAFMLLLDVNVDLDVDVCGAAAMLLT